jgi:hypothetical protein
MQWATGAERSSNIIRSSWKLQGPKEAERIFWAMHGDTRNCKELQGAAESYKEAQGAARSYREL